MWRNEFSCIAHCVCKLAKPKGEEDLKAPSKFQVRRLTDPASPLSRLSPKEILFVWPAELMVQVYVRGFKNAHPNIAYRSKKNNKKPDLPPIGSGMVQEIVVPQKAECIRDMATGRSPKYVT